MRLSAWVEENYLVDKQNGFMKVRTTDDHLLSLTNIIESRKLKRLDTYVTFIDFCKVYDSINRNLAYRTIF